MIPDDPKLTAYALDELGPAERTAFEAELVRDTEAKSVVDEIRQCSGWLAEGLAAESCPGLDPAQRLAVLHPGIGKRPVAFGTANIWLRYWRYWVTAGAAVAAGMAVMWVVGDLRKVARPQSTSSSASGSRSVAADPPDPTRGAGLNGGRADVVEGQSTARIDLTGPLEAGLQKPAARPLDGLALDGATVPDSTNRIEAQAASETAARPGVVEPARTENAGQLANAVVNSGFSVSPSQTARATAMVPLALALPIPAFMGTPTDVPANEHLEKPLDKPRPALLVPAGVVNVALRKPVASSDSSPIMGSLDRVTDGDKESHDNSFVELHRKLQWVQIDLEATREIYAIAIWHAHNTPQVYNSVVVQLADDPDFSHHVRTVFNNDYENSAGLGAGTDKQYYESYEGKLIPVAGLSARYVRAYSKGSTFSALNRYTEIEVYGLPAARATQAEPGNR